MRRGKLLLFNNKEDIGSNPFGRVKSVHSLSAKNIFIVNFYAVITQLVERQISNLKVASSSLVYRSLLIIYNYENT